MRKVSWKNSFCTFFLSSSLSAKVQMKKQNRTPVSEFPFRTCLLPLPSVKQSYLHVGWSQSGYCAQWPFKKRKLLCLFPYFSLKSFGSKIHWAKARVIHWALYLEVHEWKEKGGYYYRWLPGLEKSWEELGLVIVRKLVNGAPFRCRRQASPPKDSQHKSKTESKFKHYQTSFHHFKEICVL